MKADIERFERSLYALWRCAGYDDRPGLTSLALSETDQSLRDLLVEWMKQAGLEIRIDDMGNLFGICAGADRGLPPFAMGSHIDTVGNGGKYDGILGVLAGLEVIRCLNDTQSVTERDVMLCIWSNEEGVRFLPGMAGSAVAMGSRTAEECYKQAAVEGDTTYEAELARIGYRGSAKNHPQALYAYLELHIEQGPVLEQQNLAVGIVSGVKEMAWNQITLEGESNHAGTCPMELRRDPLLAAARVITGIEDMAARSRNSGTTVTFGKMMVYPNITTVIPERVAFTQDIRSEDARVVRDGLTEIRAMVEQAANRYHVSWRIDPIGYMQLSRFDRVIQERIQIAIEHSGLRHTRLYSGAGHDAFQISKKFPTGMIFVRTKGGKSHVPEEYAAPEDIQAGLQVFLDTAADLSMHTYEFDPV